MAENHTTEAVCLLEQGALYRRRIGLDRLTTPGDPIFAGFKPGAFSIYFGDAPIYHFDLEGRWQRAFADGLHFLKGLDATVQTIDRIREGPNLVLKRRTLGYAESSDFDSRIRSMALQLIADLHAERLGRTEPPALKARPLESNDLRDFLDRIVRWDAAAWFAHRERYLATYGALTFLPPECQNAVVLQATLGNAGNLGSGCSPAVEPSARSPAEFERHANEVAALWGRRLSQSRIVFLAGSNVLHRPEEDVKAYLTAAGRALPLVKTSPRGAIDRSADSDETAARLEGVHAMLDDFAPSRPERAAWVDYATLGLIRLSLGVWSGDRETRAIHGHNWDDNDLLATVANLKAAGLGASILALVGAGGVERAEPHVELTARLIESLDLGPGDFVFLLDEREIRDPNRSPEGLTPLRGPAWSEQQAKLKEALAPLKKRGIKVLPYTMEKQ